MPRGIVDCHSVLPCPLVKCLQTTWHSTVTNRKHTKQLVEKDIVISGTKCNRDDCRMTIWSLSIAHTDVKQQQVPMTD